jgi:hypothetical protein
MPKEEIQDLLHFLSNFPPEVQEKVLWLRDFVWDRYPQANELIYDNYNALAIGWSVTEKLGQTFCSIAAYRAKNHNIHFGFYWGAELSDPQKMLLGNGKQYRYIQVDNLVAFPETYIKQLITEGYDNALHKVKDAKQTVQGNTFIKSVVDNKRK